MGAQPLIRAVAIGNPDALRSEVDVTTTRALPGRRGQTVLPQDLAFLLHPSANPRHDAPAVLLLRHADREPILRGEDVMGAALTERGMADARRAGTALALLGIRRIALGWSPAVRCRQTAEAIAEGFGARGGVSTILGPSTGWASPYVLDGPTVWGRMLAKGNFSMLRSWFDGEQGDCLQPAPVAAQALIARMARLTRAPIDAELRVVISHDWNCALLREVCLGQPITEDTMPGLLRGLTLWTAGDRLALGDPTGSLRWFVAADGPMGGSEAGSERGPAGRAASGTSGRTGSER